jgi:hypothetical protein
MTSATSDEQTEFASILPEIEGRNGAWPVSDRVAFEVDWDACQEEA